MIKQIDRWELSKNLIPGGNSFFSKRPSFTTNKPVYYKKAKGCYIWDIDNKKFLDMSLMGVGTNVLGYSNKKINESVISSINKSNVSSLNSPQEYILAEKLIEINKWAEMVKFAKTGGEANAIAVRIARAASAKDKIAVCGYHGWHDWYLSCNLSNRENLNNHLMKELNIKGVPSILKNTSLSFEFNNSTSLLKLFDKHKNIGTIKLEIKRDISPSKEFLKTLKDVIKKYQLILIIDECTSGFRETICGVHEKFNLTPDMVIYGKALGNGFPITAVVGKKDVMNYANESFISSTYWSENIGFTAANATLDQMSELKSWEYISELGVYLKSKLLEILKNKIQTQITGMKPIIKLNFNLSEEIKINIFLSDYFEKKRILYSPIIFLSTSHTKEIIDNYLDIFNDAINTYLLKNK